MGFIARRLIKQDLESVDVLVNDIQNEYFNVVELPTTFTQGRSAFKIFGSEFLKRGVSLKMEMLDSAGNTVYVTPVDLVGEEIPPFLPYRFVTVEVYRPPVNREGLGRLTILGEIDPTAVNFQIPTQYQNTYNVKYSVPINLDLSTSINTQPIRFYKTPTIEPEEKVRARIVETPVTTTVKVFASASADIRDDLQDTTINVTTGSATQPDGIPESVSNDPASAVQLFSQDFNFRSGFSAAFPPVLARRGLQNFFASPEPEAFTISTADGGLKSSMQGATITIPEHTQTVTTISEETGQPTTEEVTVPEFETTIASVIDESTFVPADIPFIPDPASPTVTGSVNTGEIPADGGPAIIPDLVNVPISMSFTEFTDTIISSSVHFDSFMELKIRNMRTFSGDVYRLKVHGAMQSQNSGFSIMGESIVESPELIIDKSSASGFLRTGYFYTQSLVDTYWTGSSYDSNTRGDSISFLHTGSQYIDSLRLSGSNYGVNQTLVAEQKSGYEFRVDRSVPYTLTATISGIKTDKETISGTVNKEGRLYFHLTGSNLNTSKQLPTNADVGGELTDVDSNKVVVLKLDKNKEGFQKLGRVEFTFFPRLNLDRLSNTDTRLQIRADSGRWHISNLSLRPAMDSGFSPDEYTITVPLPRTTRPDKLDTFIEFYDINNNVAETITAAKDIGVSGSALVIDGDDNLLTGSLYMGNVAGAGIEMAGANSAYMRSVGYDGFITASELGQGGFMIFSGSVLPEAPDSYEGAGLEIHDGNTGDDQSFFKFRTKPSIFDVKTKTFFLGQQKTPANFISGSQGNIQISSSGFNVTADGKVTASNFLFNSGVVSEDVTILGTVSANAIQVPAQIDGVDTTQATALAFIQNTGNAKFVSASIGGWTVDATTISSNGLEIHSDGRINTTNYTSNVQGFLLTAENNGTLEVENAKIRGTLKTTVFEKETVNAVGGQLYVANSSTITGSDFFGTFVPSMSAATATMSLSNVSGFTGSYGTTGANAGEILSIKKVGATGFTTEYVLVHSASRVDAGSDIDLRGHLYVTRAYNQGIAVGPDGSGSLGDIASTATNYPEGQVVVSTGRVGTGFIRLNANPNDTTTPYMDIVERTGSGIYDIDLKARLGDLSGLNRNQLQGTAPSAAGFGLYSENVFLEGGIIANTGSIAGVKMEDNQLFLGTGVHANSNTPFYVSGKGGVTNGDFSLGDKLVWDASAGTLAIVGSIEITGGDAAAQIAGIGAGAAASASAAQTGAEQTAAAIGGGAATSASNAQNSANAAQSTATELGVVSASLQTASASLATRARISSTGLEILDSSSNVIGSYGSTMRVGFNAADKSALRIAADGSLTIGTSGQSQISMAANGNATFSGNLSAAGGTFTGVIDVGAVGLGATTASLQANTTSLQNQTTALGTASGSLLTASASLATRARISGGGLEIIDSGGTVRAKYATDTIVGDENNEHAKLSTSGLEIKDGGTTHATFAATTVIGETGTNESNIQITNSAIKLRQATTDIITLNNDGTITSTDYLIERSRLFGFGKDGTITLTSSDCTVADGGNGVGTKVSSSQIKDANGTVVCNRSSSTWIMAGDWYAYDFTLSSGRLVTNGFRLFVFGTLTIASGAIISHNGSGGGNASGGTAGAAGEGAGEGTLKGGSDGGAGGTGGAGNGGGGTGGGGGGAGGNGGIVFIAARIISNSGSITATGGDGGVGGDGGTE